MYYNFLYAGPVSEFPRFILIIRDKNILCYGGEMLMDKKQIGKYLMLALGAALTLGSSLVNAKNQDDKMKEAVAEQVAEALKNQAKES